MEEGHREEKCDHEEYRQDILIIRTGYHQPNKTHQQNYEFRSYYVGQYRSDKEAFLSFE